MGDLLKGIEFLGIPATIAVILVGLYLIINIIGCILDFKGKVVPEIINFRRYLRRRKEEKEKQAKLLERLAAKLESFEGHYSPEKIAQRNEWMDWVNKRAEVYDASVKELTKFKDTLEVTKELTLDLYINVNRNRIIDFANQVVNEDVPVSREAFNRIFKVYNEYEEILEKYGKTNGEVEVSIRIIRESYEAHMRNHTFIEDSRGY
jgi:sugar-specific transcriptional regulator TrmB